MHHLLNWYGTELKLEILGCETVCNLKLLTQTKLKVTRPQFLRDGLANFPKIFKLSYWLRTCHFSKLSSVYSLACLAWAWAYYLPSQFGRREFHHRFNSHSHWRPSQAIAGATVLNSSRFAAEQEYCKIPKKPGKCNIFLESLIYSILNNDLDWKIFCLTRPEMRCNCSQKNCRNLLWILWTHFQSDPDSRSLTHGCFYPKYGRVP